MPQQDFRARLQPKPGGAATILGPKGDPSNILNPLWATNGVLFPYTPTISTGSVVEYDQSSFIHSIYGYNSYIRSYPKVIGVSAAFTAQTTNEALYLLAVFHFFKAITKSYFGVNPYERAGTPSPVVIFNYLGEYQFNNVPVLVKNVEYTLESNIDYVPVNTSVIAGQHSTGMPATSSGGWTRVPTHVAMSIELDTQYIPKDLRDNFNLDKFRTGRLLNKGYM